ncbi:hypothetical protein F9B85_06515 [Heliorestis acidaminivorans]|uniref:Dynamin N-terminal domain-containing protein n=1 Tax=Heliorestis acidaminivorans TaxID=553427 RepID=A0A6I0F3B0_9FIRM|nr:dynamin family protein [Heliorestis acidaminivorans]KAB2952921.1 hypothetical protein F9B85_06515 [Heliorestis acidaminivorans]
MSASHQSSLQELKATLLELTDKFKQAGDETGVYRMKGLTNKLQEKQMNIAFCGHISSGKSALLNKLLGYDWLPTSPIPSSANIVTIHRGKAGAMINSSIELNPEKELPLIHQYCLDNQKAQSIELTLPHQLEAPGLVLIDTPGIDSAEKAKKLAEEEAIVTADVVVYVMDYNHVQSEINFTFAKKMKEQGKILLLLVHQIDKHCDFELDFSYFKSSSRAGFAAWDVHPEGIFYTTLNDDQHEENQVPLLQSALISFSQNRETLLPTTIYNSAKQLVGEHCARQGAKQAQLRQKWQEIIEETEDLEEALASYNTLQEQYVKLQSRTEGLQAELEREIIQVIENARITPYTTTELAQEYLVSRQPGFKVGFLFTAEKTKKEIERRLEALTADFAQHVSTQLEWHLRGLLVKVPENYGISDSDYLQEANAFAIAWDSNLIASAVKAGALANSEYIHNFTHDVAGEIKRLYRREALALAEKAVNLTKKESEQELAQLQDRLQPLTSLVEALRSLEKMDQNERHYQTQLIKLIEDKLASAVELQELIPALKDNKQEAENASISLGQAISKSAQALEDRKADKSTNASAVAVSAESVAQIPAESAQTSSYASSIAAPAPTALQQMGAKLRSFAQSIENLSGFAHMAQAMGQRAERLEENIFTVALFGAFSAGKSSVANALLGQFVLPVSPNPTTAAINKILPPTKSYPHGTVRVQLKTKADMESDVLHSLRACGLEATTLEEALELLTQLSPSQVHPTAKPHYSFLQALAKGLPHVEGHLGSIQTIKLVDFNDYVASEEKACFVEWIELYYSCPLTDRGIMLVDTPGADSINARHTGVAFEYIKNADALLFVTYYNSAFSHADRDFLFQLGRVKDTFALDKMFFLVNAVDLAKTEEELNEVLRHVEDRVSECGIKEPRIFPISSQTALLARLEYLDALTATLEKTYRQRISSLRSAQKATAREGEPSYQEGLRLSGFEAFEEAFFHFTLEELTAVAVQAGENDLARCLSALDEVIATAHTDASSRRIKKATYEASRTQLHRLIQGIESKAESNFLQQELEELVYYLKQRLFFRFGDLFNRYFNPAVLQNDSGAITKGAMHHSLESLIKTIEQELAQELRATSLRLEKFLNGRAEHLQSKLAELVRQEAHQLQLSQREVATITTPEFPLNRLSTSSNSLVPLLSMIKSPKDFFEGSGRARLREALEKQLQAPVDDYLREGRDLLYSIYEPALERSLNKISTEALQAVDDYYESLTAALELTFDLEEVEALRTKLGRIQLEQAN